MYKATYYMVSKINHLRNIKIKIVMADYPISLKH